MLDFRDVREIERAGKDAVRAFCATFPDKRGAEDLFRMLLAAAEDEEQAEYAVAGFGAYFLVRVREYGSYFFLYPYPMCDEVRENALIAALHALTDYARYAEIPPVFADVPTDDLAVFSHAGYADTEVERDADTATVTVRTPLDRLTEMPVESGEVLMLDAVTAADGAWYGPLCRDGETNRYYGYAEEAGATPTDADCTARAARDFSRRVAMNFAVRDRQSGEPVGDAVLYAFDGRGGCEAAVRILPAFRRRGYGREAFSLLFAVGRRMGLAYVDMKVMPENLPSCALLAGMAADRGTDEQNRRQFRVNF